MGLGRVQSYERVIISGIKHSAFVNWADEQRSQLVKRVDHQKNHDLELAGDHRIATHRILDDESDNEKGSSSCYKSDAFHVNMVFGDKLDEEESKSPLK